jgi:hypothetical protein
MKIDRALRVPLSPAWSLGIRASPYLGLFSCQPSFPPSIYLHWMGLGSLAGWVLHCSPSLLMRRRGYGTWDALAGSNMILILMSCAQSSINIAALSLFPPCPFSMSCLLLPLYPVSSLFSPLKRDLTFSSTARAFLTFLSGD